MQSHALWDFEGLCFAKISIASCQLARGCRPLIIDVTSCQRNKETKMLHQPPSITAGSYISRKTAKTLVWTSFTLGAFILAAGICWELVAVNDATDRRFAALSLFGGYNNSTSWYQSAGLVVCAVIWFMAIDNSRASSRPTFFVMPSTLLYMAISEHTNLDHELTFHLASAISPAGAAFHIQMAAALAATAVLATIARSALLQFGFAVAPFAAAAAVYILGVVGLELVAFEASGRGASPEALRLLYATEEILETVGVWLFLVASCKLIVAAPQVSSQVSPQDSPGEFAKKT